MKKFYFILFFFIVALFAPDFVFAGGGPENVALLVNEDSWASLAIANKFIALRQIPYGNVIYFRGLKSHERTSVGAFKEEILLPALEALERRALAGQIDYLVYSSDFPTEINIQEDVRPPIHDKTLIPYASLTGLTYLYQMVVQKDNRYYRLQSNGYMSPPFLGVADTPWSTMEKALYQKVLKLLTDREWEKAQSILEKLILSHPKSPSLLYNLACSYARQGKRHEALLFLEKAIETGWCNFIHTLQDQDLEAIRNEKKMHDLVEKMKEIEPLYNVHSMGFRNAYNFNEFGAIVRENQGKRYLLSMMLGVTSGRGNSLEEILDYLSLGAKADSTFPKQTIYYMLNSDIRSKTRQPAFPSAIAVLKEMGIKAEMPEGTIPVRKKDILGLMAGTAQFDWNNSQNSIIPGAICEHFTSLGGVMKETSSQTPMTEFLRYGAVATSGTVVEPYALAAKFPSPFLHVHYARGCTAAEAFYQSVAAPFQLLLVGDPLCSPWGRKPAVLVKGVSPGQTVKGTIKLYPDAKKGYPHAIHNYQMFLAGKRYAVCRPGDSFSLDTTLLLDGEYKIVVVATEDDPIQSQGRITIPIFIKNGDYHIDFFPHSLLAGWNDTVSVRASMKDAKEIVLLHNARRLGSIQGEEGEIKIPASLLGLGKGELQLMATKENPKEGAIAFLPFEIIPSSYFAPISENMQFAEKGLKLSLPGGETKVVSSTLSSDWLSNAGVNTGKIWQLEGYFDIKKRDIYQFQIFCSGEIEIRINHQLVCQKKECNGWMYIPVAMMQGIHHFQLTGKLKNINMNLTFGNSGTYSLNKNFFYHFR